MKRVQDQAPPPTEEERQWIEKNSAAQKKRHAAIVEAMDALSPQREAWIDGFLERLQVRGFNYNGDALVTIDKDDIPEKPNRPFKVVF